MKNNLFRILMAPLGLLGILFLLTACPYSSEVPIDEGTVVVPAGLAGQWVAAADKEAENPTYFVIAVDDKYHATAKKMEFADTAYNATIFHLTFSNVGGETFMNAKEEGGDKYSLYKFSFDAAAGQVVTQEVTDYIKETFSTSKELKDFVAKNKSNSYFFTNSTDTYTRK